MRREEEIKKKAFDSTNNYTKYLGFIEGAKWADNNPRKVYKEDIVPYKLAVQLKAKGAPQSSFYYYDEQGCINIPMYNLTGTDKPKVAAPHIHDVLKWLREEKRIYIMIDRSSAMNNSWHHSICVDDDFKGNSHLKSPKSLA